MPEKVNNLQDMFLNSLRRTKTPVTMFLVKGVKLQGIITWFDNFSVLLRRDGQAQLTPNEAVKAIMGTPLREARETFEREYLRVQIRRFSGNISRTANFIGMERSALRRKLKALGLADSRGEGGE